MVNPNTSYSWLIAAISLFSTAAAVIGVLFIIEFCHGIYFQISPANNSKRKIKTSTKSMWLITVCAMFGFLITCLFGTGTRIVSLTKSSRALCGYIAVPGSFLYIISKQLMYLLFILRLYTVYKDSQYEYKLAHINIMVSVSILLNLIILICMYCFGVTVVLDVVNTSYKNCTMVFPLWLSGSAALSDLLHQSFLIYLFVKPLILIQKRKQHNSRHNAQANLRRLCLKYYILGLCASISTTMFCLSVPMTGSV
eukprot:UN06258